MQPPDRLAMSNDVEAAEWIRDRLRPPEQRCVTSIFPAGFEAYARLLHPAQLPDDRHELVRWIDASRWSGVEIDDCVQWHQIALPRESRPTPPP
ncbi:MAG: hypothetical protein ACRDVC_08360 [Acidimicrobiales bacterium]